MINLHLDSTKAHLLSKILEEDLDELQTEIAKTDQKDFRDSLKDRKALLESITEEIKLSESSEVRQIGQRGVL